MSCMEHECTRCDWFAMDNQPPAAWKYCPDCGANVMHSCDEQDDRDDPDEP